MTENKTAEDRKAEIHIVCDRATIIVKIEQKATNKPGTPEDPTPVFKHRYVKKISLRSSRFDDDLTLTYDNKMQITSMLTEAVERYDGQESKFTELLSFKYEGNKVICTNKSSSEGSALDLIEITLDSQGRATKMVQKGFYGVGSISPVETRGGSSLKRSSNIVSKSKDSIKWESLHEYIYDANGYISEVVYHNEEDSQPGNVQGPFKYVATWDAGNLIKILSKRENPVVSPYDILTYSDIENKKTSNLDISVIFTESEWHSSLIKTVGLLGYMGNRNSYMQSLATSYDYYSLEHNPIPEHVFYYTYTLDEKGYVVAGLSTKKDSADEVKYTIEYVD